MSSTNGFNNMTRFMCMRYDDEHLFLAVDRPYSRVSEGYAMLVEQADHVGTLDEGSQVFVYNRGEGKFDIGLGHSEEEDFSEFVWDTAREVGNIAVDLEIEPVVSHSTPGNFLPV